MRCDDEQEFDFMQSGRGAKATARILLLDSDAENRAAIACDLENGANGPVLISQTESGREASTLLRGGAFDLLVLDLNSLADMALPTGEAVTRLVRLAGAALVITLSQGTSLSLSVAAMQAGAHDHLTKPLDGAAMMARIEKLARRHGLAKALCANDGETAGFVGTCHPPINVEPAIFPRRDPRILPMWQQEQMIIEDAIAKFSGNIARAAAALEISPSTIYRKRQMWEQMAMVRRGTAA